MVRGFIPDGLHSSPKNFGFNKNTKVSIYDRSACIGDKSPHHNNVCQSALSVLCQAHSAMRALCGRLCRFARWTVMTRCSGTGVLTVSFVRLQEFSCV